MPFTRVRSHIATSVTTGGGGGGTGNPPGSSVTSDAMGPFTMKAFDTNALPTDTSSYAINALYTDTNNTPTETETFTIGNIADSNTTPTEAWSNTLTYASSGAYSFTTGTTGFTGVVTAWGGGGGGGEYAQSSITFSPSTT